MQLRKINNMFHSRFTRQAHKPQLSLLNPLRRIGDQKSSLDAGESLPQAGGIVKVSLNKFRLRMESKGHHLIPLTNHGPDALSSGGQTFEDFRPVFTRRSCHKNHCRAPPF